MIDRETEQDKRILGSVVSFGCVSTIPSNDKRLTIANSQDRVKQTGQIISPPLFQKLLISESTGDKVRAQV